MMKIPPELEGEYIVRVMDLPEGSRGFVIYDDEDFANVYVNAHLNHESQVKASDHEMVHVINDDIHNDDDIRKAEARADGNAARLKSIPHLMKASDMLPPAPPPPSPPPKQKFKPSPHQLAVLNDCISELDAFLFDDRYEF
jgi:hypothetical protein